MAAVDPATYFGDLVGAKEVAMAAVAPRGTHAHCAGFEIWNEAGETVASWKRPMPKGPQGQKRAGNVVGAAVMVAKIATGEIEDNATPADKAHHSLGGKKCGAAPANAPTAEKRSNIATRAAAKRLGA